MIGKRLLELLAIAMIGEGAAGLLAPRRYLLLWSFGPQWYRGWVESIATNRRFMRILFLAEFALGLLMTLRMTDTDDTD
jgi:hypothetical protein